MEGIRNSNLWAGDMAKIAVKILDHLEASGKSQRWLADELGVSPQQVTKIVKGRQNMSWGKIMEIQAVLGNRLVEVAEEKFKKEEGMIIV